MLLHQHVLDYFGVGHDLNTKRGSNSLVFNDASILWPLTFLLGRIFTILGWSVWLAGRATGLAVGLLKTLKNTYSRVQYLECMSIPPLQIIPFVSILT